MDNVEYDRAAGHFMDVDGTLNNDGFVAIARGFEIASRAIYLNNVTKGWWEDTNRNIGELLALVHSEVSEALEAYRDGDKLDEITYEYPSGITSDQPTMLESEVILGDCDPEEVVLGKPVGVASELADVIIRILDMAEGLNIPVTQALIEKHQYNQTRAYRHGNKKA